VVIATQDHWHAPIAVAAARAGKDMYCEKPLGVAVTEGRAIRDAVRRYGRVLQTGTQQRSDRKFRFACLPGPGTSERIANPRAPSLCPRASIMRCTSVRRR
jgi:hypothetical protein